MTEKAYSGLTAAIYINSTILGYMNNVSLELTREVVEVMQFGAQYKEKLPAVKDWSASADGTVAFAAGGSQHKLYQAFETGEEVTLKMALDASVYFEGKALITSLKVDGAPDDKLNINAEFAGSKGVTFNLPELVVVTIGSGAGGTTSPAGIIKLAKGTPLTVTCTPAAGKVADYYGLNGATPAVTITANTFTTSNLSADTAVYVTFTDVE